MVAVQKVDPSIFPRILPLLRVLDNIYFTETDWRRVIDYPWERIEDYCGYALFDREEVVGFNGCIFSQRVVDGKKQQLCNLTSWVVREDYRGYSLALMLPLLQLKNYTLTDLTASLQAHRVLKRFGFQELDQGLIVLWPLPAQIRWRHQGHPNFIQDHERIRRQLKGEDLNIFQDHLHLPACSHFLFLNQDRYCYGIYTIVRNNTPRPYCSLHYISDLDQFYKWNRLIRTELIRCSQTYFVLVDSRAVRGLHLPFSYELPHEIPRLYKSPNLQPGQIDNLYSELVLLNFSTIPSPIPTGRELGRRVLA